MALIEEMDKWIKRYLAKGNTMVRYKCPLCEGFCYSVILDKGQVHDTLTTCPECGKPHFKIACDDRIEVFVNGNRFGFQETKIIDKDSY